MILPIVQHPAEMLKQVSKPIEDLDDRLKKLATDMLETLTHHKALGLSAIQVGVPVRMFVISKKLGVPAILFINPKITEVNREIIISNEGCLSINNGKSFFNIKRSKSIKFVFYNSYIDEVAYEFIGEAARVIQHEMDHLDGKLILDYAEFIRA